MQIAKLKEKSIFFTIFLTLAVFAPLLRMQFISGTLVNAVLFLAVLALGLKAALVISLLPSIIAWASGILPFSLALLLPLIMLSNCLLSTVFYLLKKQPYLIRAFVAAIAKFLFLFGFAFIMSFYLSQELAFQTNAILGFVQLATALLGAGLAYFISRFKN